MSCVVLSFVLCFVEAYQALVSQLWLFDFPDFSVLLFDVQDFSKEVRGKSF